MVSQMTGLGMLTKLDPDRLTGLQNLRSRWTDPPTIAITPIVFPLVLVPPAYSITVTPVLASPRTGIFSGTTARPFPDESP
ncbi:MAG: hypothetical protein LVS60_11745 [Nodosilinea sp. LVE1205-7]